MTLILADAIWPGLYLTALPCAPWAIGLGLVIEFFFLRKITTLSFRMCVVADICMNAVSALIGFFVRVFAGFALDFLFENVFNLGHWDRGRWLSILLLVVLVNSILEWLVLWGAFRQKIARKGFLWLCFANSLSVALALYCIHFLI